MNTLNAYLALLASNERKAVLKATRRHIHLSPRPFVIVGYHLAGDIGAPLALMWGTDSTIRPDSVVVPEPRNRQLRFDALETFGYAFTEYLSNFAEASTVSGKGGQTELVCIDAPQIVVPNRATAEWLFGIVGRFTRHLRTDGNPAAPPVVALAGKHLSFFHNLLPGSSLVLPATEILRTHWQSGQLPSEDLNLSALLGWISPTKGTDGPAAAREGENYPPAGPLSDPNWDAKELTDIIDQWHAAGTDEVVRSAIQTDLDVAAREQLDHTYEDCWRALGLVETLPEGDRVAHRWEIDRKRWTRHHYAMEAGTAFFRNIPTPVQSARTLNMMESSTTELQAEMALDDPLIMATYITSGEALSARVSSIDTTRMVPGPKRQVRRPLVKFEPLLPFSRPPGTVLFLASNPGIKLEVLGTTGGMVHAQVNGGAVSPRTLDRLPNPGDVVVLSPFGNADFYPRPKYDEVPWTHHFPEQAEGQFL